MKRLPPCPERTGNSVELLYGGLDYFPRLLAALGAATRQVFLETYIFADDPTGRAVCDALAQAAGRGVDVRVVMDGFGGQQGVRAHAETLRKAGVQVRVFRPEGFLFKPSPRRLRRMHRKMVVIDGEVGFLGGINILDDLNHENERMELAKARVRAYALGFLRSGRPSLAQWAEWPHVKAHFESLDLQGPRYDFAVELKGPVVQDMALHMQWLWMQVDPSGRVVDTFKRSWWAERADQLTELGAAHAQALAAQVGLGQARVGLLVRDNIGQRRAIEKAYLQAIGQAQTSILIANAYFLPGRKIRRALLAARKRGVLVKLLLQGRVEYHFQHFATQALYEPMLAAGVEVYEYRPGYLHAKVAVVDAQWATVGSSNLDPLSLLLAREANVGIQHRPFAQALKAELLRAMADDSTAVCLQAHLQRPLRHRLVSWLCYKLMQVAVLLGASGSRY